MVRAIWRPQVAALGAYEKVPGRGGGVMGDPDLHPPARGDPGVHPPAKGNPDLRRPATGDPVFGQR